MIKTTLALFGALMLAACANMDTPMSAPGNFTSYRDLLTTKIRKSIETGPYAKTTPAPVKTAYAECASDFILSGFTADERSRLDAYARYEIKLSHNETNDLDRKARERLGGDLTYGTLDHLDSFCPDDVPSFRQYFKS